MTNSDYLTADIPNNNSSVTYINFSYEYLLALEEISDVCHGSKMFSLQAIERKPHFLIFVFIPSFWINEKSY
jgi:hypothetical protein